VTINITRRTFALTGACAVIISRSASAQTAEIKVSHFLPPNHTIQKYLVLWSDDLEKQSAGRLKLRIYPAGQLGGGPNRQFDAARNGVVDIAFSLAAMP
jgi:TRAP-type C4-dicarboxylate transport system substrate-binding protein